MPETRTGSESVGAPMLILWILAAGGGLWGLLAVAWLVVVVPAAVAGAKRRQHRGSWWALYVLGLHAVLSPLYCRLRFSRGVKAGAARLISMIYQLTTIPTGAEIPLSASVGKGLMLGHTTGVVFNRLARIGDYCVITPGVVLGGDGRGGFPVIGKNVYIGANAVVAGSVFVGDGATIGAGAVITANVPAFALAAGNPARILKEHYHRSYYDNSKEVGCESLASRGAPF